MGVVQSLLSHWELDIQHVSITPPPTDALQPAALASLTSQLEQLSSQLQQLQSDYSIIHINFESWNLSQSQVADALVSLVNTPALSTLTFALFFYDDQPLTDALLGAVLRLGQRVRSLVVPSVQLKTDRHVKVPWPWEELLVFRLDEAQLLRLPDPGGKTRNIECRYLDVSGIYETEVSHTVWHTAQVTQVTLHRPCRSYMWH